MASIPGLHSVDASNSSANNSVTSLYISPSTLGTSIETGSSFTTLTTQSTTIPDYCNRDAPDDGL